MTSLEELKVGDHVCCLYESEEEFSEVIIPFVKNGLVKGEKIFYLADSNTAERVLDLLRKEGLDVEIYLTSGQLKFLTAKEIYSYDGFFDPDKMIELLQKETEQALTEGYAAIRVTGEMTWALQNIPGSERLIEYEAKLNLFFPHNKVYAICQYDMRRFDPTILLNVLRTHPIAIIGTEIYNNFYYIPVEKFLKPNREEILLEHWKKNLEKQKKLELMLNEERNKVSHYLDLISHDINKIFHNIALAVELCSKITSDNNQNPELRTFLDIISQQIERGAKLIETVRKLALIKNELESIYPIEICDMLRKAIKFITESFSTKIINFKIDNPHAKLFVQANALLGEGFENILHNAVKHNQNSPINICIRITRSPMNETKCIKIEFIDNGKGIPDTQKMLIFEKSHELKDHKNGLGIGLSIIKEMISNFHGKVWVEDRILGDYTQGSKFCILIPEAEKSDEGSGK